MQYQSRKPILVIRPSIINALFPLFFKNLMLLSLLAASAFFIINIINSIFADLLPTISLEVLIISVIVLTLLSISVKVLVLRVTKYIFYETNAVKEFKLLIIRRRSVIYNKITNITLKVSVWDRITSAGNITLHTGDDDTPDIVMKFIKNPAKIEGLIYSLIHKKNTQVTHQVMK